MCMEQSKGKSLCSKACRMWLFFLIAISYYCVVAANQPPTTTKCYECGGPFGGNCEDGEGQEMQASIEVRKKKSEQLDEHKRKTNVGGGDTNAQDTSRQLGGSKEGVVCLAVAYANEKVKTCFVGALSETPLCIKDENGFICSCVGDLCNKNGIEKEPSKPLDPSETIKCVECGGPFGGDCSKGQVSEIVGTKDSCWAKSTAAGKYMTYQVAGLARYAGKGFVLACIGFSNSKGGLVKTCSVSDVPLKEPECQSQTDERGVTFRLCLCSGDLCNKDPSFGLSLASTILKPSRLEIVVKLALTSLCVALASW